MDSTTNAVTPNKRLHFEFLLPFLLHPRATFAQVAQKRGTWMTPLLVISLLLIARVMLATPAPEPAFPGDFVPEPGRVPVGPKGQEPQQDAMLISAHPQDGDGGDGEFPQKELPPDASGGAILANLVPALGATVGLWVGWFLLSVLLYVGMVISGSNNSFTETLNLTAWASLPLALRQVVLLVAALAFPSVSTNPSGISALAASFTGPAGMFMTSLLRPVDIYLVWQVILIVIGLRQLSPLGLRRVVGITIVAVALFLALAAMPGFLSAIFAQLSTPTTPTGGFG